MIAIGTIRWVAGLAVVSLLAQGCAAWRPVYRTTPAQYLTEHHPKRARFTLADSAIVLSRPRAAGDSIAGFQEVGDSLGARRTIAASDVRALAIRGPSPWPMWVAGGASVALLVALLTYPRGDFHTNP